MTRTWRQWLASFKTRSAGRTGFKPRRPGSLSSRPRMEQLEVRVVPSGEQFLVTGADGGPHVKVFDAATGALRSSFYAYDPAFTGGARVAVGDVNGDGTPDLITGAGPGGGPHVRVFDGVALLLGRATPLYEFMAYDPAFRGGVFVAAGDVNGDGLTDVIVGAGAGGGPHVKVYSGKDGTLLRNFMAYDVGFRGGARVAAGDVNGDGTVDIVTGAGPGGGPHVKIFSGTDGALLQSYFGYDTDFRGGVFVAAGDVNGDGRTDVITGAGAGGGPHVRAFSGADRSPLLNFMAFDPAFRGGVEVAATDVNGDGTPDLIAGAGAGGSPQVKAFSGTGGALLLSFLAYTADFPGGVSVGGTVPGGTVPGGTGVGQGFRLTVTSPSPGQVLNQNAVVTGRVTGDLADLAALQAQVDAGPLIPVAFDAAGNFSFTTSLPLDGSADGPHAVHFRATDRAGTVTPLGDATFTLDPLSAAAAAPPVDPTVVTTLAAATQFLYSGSNPVQTGVAPGTINPVRAAVLRGRVLAADGSPLVRVAVTVLNHPEFGSTLTDLTGTFDLAVNGGGPLTVNYAKAGFLTDQRQADVPWQDYAPMPDVVMIPADSQVTPIDLSAATPIQVAQGNPVTDADGTRQATLLFSQGTQATMTLPDGTTQPLTSLHVRATEYTVGPNGPAAMPGELPPTSGYTYAAELTVDEAQSAGAKAVTFDKPVVLYVQNFLGFPVGGIVPVGYYDRSQGVWIASPNGVTIQILSVTQGEANVDTDGSGQAAASTALTALGITDAERQQLATLYQPGQSLWRVQVSHFTPFDLNWPIGPPADATNPDQPEPTDMKVDDHCNLPGGSIIDCHNQTLGENVGVAGTPFQLFYESDRVPGRTDNRTLNIPLSGSSVPSSLKRIELTIFVAGQRFAQTFSAAAGQTFTFTWDGKDAFGRGLTGTQLVTIYIGYVYNAVYLAPAGSGGSVIGLSFGGRSNDPNVSISTNRARQEATITQKLRATLSPWDARTEGLGGWTLDVQHAYDPAGHVLYLGDGGRRSAADINSVITTVTGNSGGQGFSGDGGPATQAVLNNPRSVAVAPDGSIYIGDEDNLRIRRIGPDGIINTVAGGGNPTSGNGDGGQATQAILDGPRNVAVGPDGSFYIADTPPNSTISSRVRRVGPDGVITTVAGGGTLDGFSADGHSAMQAFLPGVVSPELGSDGSLYFESFINNNPIIRKVAPDGILSTVRFPPSIFRLTGAPFAVGPDDSLYVGVKNITDNRIGVARLGPDGVFKTVAGGGSSGDGGPATQAGLGEPLDIALGLDGSVYITTDDVLNGGSLIVVRVRRVGTDGIITTVVGGGTQGSFSADGGPATQASLGISRGLAVAPNGALYLADDGNQAIRLVGSFLPGFTATDIAVHSKDGSELYLFNAEGRHLRTLDTLTGVNRYQFGYDAAGRLISVTDGDGNITRIERDANGNPTAIAAPGGQRTTLRLDANGYLSTIANPANEAVALTSSASGLLATFTDPKGGVHRFTYDAGGFLTKDEDPVGGFTALARTESAGSLTVRATTALGKVTTYEVQHLRTGEVRQAVTGPGGARTEELIGTDGRRTFTFADGTVTTEVIGPDPRFGMQAALTTSLTTTLPSGLQEVFTGQRTVTLTDPNNALSLQTLTDTLTDNGHTFTRTYNAAAHTLTVTSPAGRQTVITLDALGRVIRRQPAPGVMPITSTYDARGRLTQVRQGDESLTLAYDAANRLVSLTDAAGQQTTYAYDSADRLIQFTLPTGASAHFAYDANGNRTQVVMPDGAVHTLAYTALDQPAGYTPPDNGSYTTSYNADRKLSGGTLPDARALTASYDGGGRLTGVVYPEATETVGYAPGNPSGRPTSVARTTPGGSTQAIAFSYDGDLLTGATWTGVAQGAYTYRYDANFRPTGMDLVSGADTVPRALTHDADGLLTGDGPFTITRAGPAGAASLIGDGTLRLAFSYDTLARLAGRTLTAAGQQVYQGQLTYDTNGRIVQQTETVAGDAHTRGYTYDAEGRLTRVTLDGTTVEAYAYDANGNRTSRQVGTALAESATYDVQDRLVQRGGVAYQFNADGFLAQRGTDTFVYSARGELLSATVGGRTVTYAYDGLGRRVGRTDSSGTYQYLYGNLNASLQVTATRSPAGVLTTYFYDGAGRLYALERAGARFYLATDHLGTPRVVTDAAGNVVKVLDYDSFGVPTADSNPGFDLPLGFAGGLADAATGLVHFGFRDYDPAAGRWTARDPILFAGGQGNLYAYVGNDPINSSDPSGLKSCVTQTPGKEADLVGQVALGASPGALAGLNQLGAGVFAANSDAAILAGRAALSEAQAQNIVLARTGNAVFIDSYRVAQAGEQAFVGAAEDTALVEFGALTAAGVAGGLIGTGADQLFTYLNGESLGELLYDKWEAFQDPEYLHGCLCEGV